MFWSILGCFLFFVWGFWVGRRMRAFDQLLTTVSEFPEKMIQALKHEDENV